MRLFSEWYSNYNVSTFSLLFPRTCAPAVSKTRTVSFSFPCLARTRLFPGACPRTASVGRGPQKAFLHRSYDTAAAPGKSRTQFVPFPGLARPRGCAGHVAHRVCCLCPTAHARGCFRVRARARPLFPQAHIRAGQIARASVYLRSLYQKGHVKSKRMDEFYRTFIRFLSRLCCGGRKRGASARAKRRDKRRTGAVRNGAAQGITASGGEILTRTKPNRERMDNR